MSAHTPGPWYVSGLEVMAADDRKTLICTGYGSTGNKQANADRRLMAAAPELLDALRALLSGYDEEDGCISCGADPGCPECTIGTMPHSWHSAA